MDRPLLNDEKIFPDDRVLGKVLGKTLTLWKEFGQILDDSFSSITRGWKYYRDGKAWLCRLMQKKKTVCWVSMRDHFFRMTFYFTEKNSKGIKDLDIDQKIKGLFNKNKTIGRLRALTVEIRIKGDLKNAVEVIKYKISIL